MALMILPDNCLCFHNEQLILMCACVNDMESYDCYYCYSWYYHSCSVQGEWGRITLKLCFCTSHEFWKSWKNINLMMIFFSWHTHSLYKQFIPILLFFHFYDYHVVANTLKHRARKQSQISFILIFILLVKHDDFNKHLCWSRKQSCLVCFIALFIIFL